MLKIIKRSFKIIIKKISILCIKIIFKKLNFEKKIVFYAEKYLRQTLKYQTWTFYSKNNISPQIILNKHTLQVLLGIIKGNEIFS